MERPGVVRCPKCGVVRCPKCGEPARVVLIERGVVRIQIRSDGSHGDVLSLRGRGRVVGYECGGEHAWEVD